MRVDRESDPWVGVAQLRLLDNYLNSEMREQRPVKMTEHMPTALTIGALARTS